jgi:hypothetical protein
MISVRAFKLQILQSIFIVSEQYSRKDESVFESLFFRSIEQNDNIHDLSN